MQFYILAIWYKTAESQNYVLAYNKEFTVFLCFFFINGKFKESLLNKKVQGKRYKMILEP